MTLRKAEIYRTIHLQNYKTWINAHLWDVLTLGLSVLILLCAGSCIFITVLKGLKKQFSKMS